MSQVLNCHRLKSLRLKPLNMTRTQNPIFEHQIFVIGICVPYCVKDTKTAAHHFYSMQFDTSYMFNKSYSPHQNSTPRKLDMWNPYTAQIEHSLISTTLKFDTHKTGQCANPPRQNSTPCKFDRSKT